MKFLIKSEKPHSGGYFVKFVKKASFTWAHKSDAHQFETEKEAKDFIHREFDKDIASHCTVIIAD